MLAVNNLAVPVADAKLVGKREEVGGARRWGGQWADQRRRILRTWEVETPPLVMDRATRLKHWIMGRGHHWSFDVDLYSDKGLGPSTYSAAPVIATGVTKFSEPSTAFAFIGSAGQTCTWTLPLDGPDASWTVARWVWVQTDGTPSWRHYVDTYDAKTATQSFYKDNVVTGVGSILNYALTFSTASVAYLQRARNLANSANDSVWVEDLVMVPYAMDTDMVAALFAAPATSPFGPCPDVRVTGDLIEEAGPVVARAVLTRRPYLQGQPAGLAWQDNMGTLVFQLHEV